MNVTNPEKDHLIDLLRPIGEIPDVSGWKDIPIRESQLTHEPLVPLGKFSNHERVATSSAYADEHFSSPYPGGLKGADVALFVRAGVAERLEAAQSFLPSGLHLLIMDGYRSLDVQGALYDQYEQGLRKQHPGWTGVQISAETQKYVSLPSHDEGRPSPHNTAASADVVLVELPVFAQTMVAEIDERLAGLEAGEWQARYLLQMHRDRVMRRRARMLDFGTRFDHGGPEAAVRYYENLADSGRLRAEDEGPLRNRRLLHNVMATAGLMPYADEWWHYNDPASQMGAKVAGRDYAEYGAAQLSADNRAFAAMRHQHHTNSILLSEGFTWTPPPGLEEHYALSRAAVRGEDLRNVWGLTMDVARIAPPEDKNTAA